MSSYAPQGGNGQSSYGSGAPEQWPQGVAQQTAPPVQQRSTASPLTGQAQRTIVRPYVSPISEYSNGHSPRGGGSKGGRTALLVVGVVVLLGALGGTAAFLFSSGIADDIIAAIRGESGRELTASPGTDWETVTVLADGGSLAYDPAWTDATELMASDETTAELSEMTGGTASLDGMWFTDGDILSGGVMMMAFSVADLSAESDPLLELHAFVDGATEEGQTLTTVSEEAVQTREGLSGYIGQYDLDMEGQAMLVNVGVVVEGEQQVYLYTLGNVEFPTAIDDLEAVMNSLTIG